MGALLGFVFGYVVGVKAGPEGLEELRKAWQTLSASEEFQGMLAAAMGFAQNMLTESGGTVAAQLQSFAASNGHLLEGLAGNGNLATTWQEISESQEFKALLEGGTQFVGSLLAQGSSMLSGREMSR